MGALPKTRMTVDEYLRWAQTQESGRYELVDGQVVMMSPETVRHVHVKNEAWLALRLKELTPQERATLRAAAPILEKLSQS